MPVETATTSHSAPRKRPRRRKIDVLEEQVAILREIHAPQDVIAIAERVLQRYRGEQDPEHERHP